MCKHNRRLPARTANLPRQKRCQLMPVNSSIAARTAVCSCGPKVKIAVCFAPMATTNVRQCSRKRERVPANNRQEIACQGGHNATSTAHGDSYLPGAPCPALCCLRECPCRFDNNEYPLLYCCLCTSADRYQFTRSIEGQVQPRCWCPTPHLARFPDLRDVP